VRLRVVRAISLLLIRLIYTTRSYVEMSAPETSALKAPVRGSANG